MVASVAEEWEAVNIRVARVVVETDAHLAGSYPTTPTTLGGNGQSPHCPVSQSWWSRHPFLSDLRSSRVCSNL
jgi:hypothetical protein